jgi:hypothetical protein
MEQNKSKQTDEDVMTKIYIVYSQVKKWISNIIWDRAVFSKQPFSRYNRAEK